MRTKYSFYQVIKVTEMVTKMIMRIHLNIKELNWLHSKLDWPHQNLNEILGVKLIPYGVRLTSSKLAKNQRILIDPGWNRNLSISPSSCAPGSQTKSFLSDFQKWSLTQSLWIWLVLLDFFDFNWVDILDIAVVLDVLNVLWSSWDLAASLILLFPQLVYF